MTALLSQLFASPIAEAVPVSKQSSSPSAASVLPSSSSSVVAIVVVVVVATAVPAVVPVDSDQSQLLHILSLSPVGRKFLFTCIPFLYFDSSCGSFIMVAVVNRYCR